MSAHSHVKPITLLPWYQWHQRHEQLEPRRQQLHSPELCLSNAILELVAIYAAQQKPRDQQEAIANCMAMLAAFKDLRILWSNYYQKVDIWEPLLLQKPLLMDPVNPFVNVADPQSFDPRELMDKAATTHFFW